MAAIMYESYYGVSSLGSDYLMHHGIKGQKWYHRRFQNEDGTLTAAGRIRYGVGEGIKKVGNAAKSVVGGVKKAYRTVDRGLAKLAIRRGDAGSLNKHASNLTEEELTEAYKRINTLQQIDNLKNQRQQNNFNRFTRGVSAIKTTVELGVAAGTGIKKFTKWISEKEEDAAKNSWKENKDANAKAMMSEIRKKMIQEGETDGAKIREALKKANDSFYSREVTKKDREFRRFTNELSTNLDDIWSDISGKKRRRKITRWSSNGVPGGNTPVKDIVDKYSWM